MFCRRRGEPSLNESAFAPLIDQRREEVLAAAAGCFMRRGYEATTMDDVAEALGATKGRVYHHFRSKPDLFFAVYRRAMEINRNAVKPAYLSGGTGAERLAAMARAHALVMMEHQSFQRVVTQGLDLWRFGGAEGEHAAVFAELMGLRRDYEDLFRRALEEARADGSLRVRDRSLAVRNLLGALNWVTVWYSPRAGETRADRETLAAATVETLMDGYRA